MPTTTCAGSSACSATSACSLPTPSSPSGTLRFASTCPCSSTTQMSSWASAQSIPTKTIGFSSVSRVVNRANGEQRRTNRAVLKAHHPTGRPSLLTSRWGHCLGVELRRSDFASAYPTGGSDEPHHLGGSVAPIRFRDREAEGSNPRPARLGSPTASPLIALTPAPSASGEPSRQLQPIPALSVVPSSPCHGA